MDLPDSEEHQSNTAVVCHRVISTVVLLKSWGGSYAPNWQTNGSSLSQSLVTCHRKPEALSMCAHAAPCGSNPCTQLEKVTGEPSSQERGPVRTEQSLHWPSFITCVCSKPEFGCMNIYPTVWTGARHKLHLHGLAVQFFRPWFTCLLNKCLEVHTVTALM